MSTDTLKYNLNFGCIAKEFYTEYINNYVQKNLQSKCNKILEEYDYIEYYSIGLNSDKNCCYSELWLLDISNNTNDYYLPVYISDINTSSCYSLAKCYLEYEEIEKPLDEILEMCPKSTRQQIRNILFT